MFVSMGFCLAMLSLFASAQADECETVAAEILRRFDGKVQGRGYGMDIISMATDFTTEVDLGCAPTPQEMFVFVGAANIEITQEFFNLAAMIGSRITGTAEQEIRDEAVKCFEAAVASSTGLSGFVRNGVSYQCSAPAFGASVSISVAR